MSGLTDAELELNRRLRPFLEDMARIERDGEARRAKADPKKYRLTRVFEKPLSYRYFRGRKGVSFCYSCHRNVAGYFLIWTQTESKGGAISRDDWDATVDKKDAIATQRQRSKR